MFGSQSRLPYGFLPIYDSDIECASAHFIVGDSRERVDLSLFIIFLIHVSFSTVSDS